MLTRKGMFEGIVVYESRWMPRGAGMALPGFGIIVYHNAYKINITLLRHEFGHILQARQTGLIAFYFRIGIPSLWSAFRDGKKGHLHHRHWTEVWANALSREYFSLNKS